MTRPGLRDMHPWYVSHFVPACLRHSAKMDPRMVRRRRDRGGARRGSWPRPGWPAPGRRVLVLEKKALPGGTSYVFQQGRLCLPHGAAVVLASRAASGSLLAEAGVDGPLGLPPERVRDPDARPRRRHLPAARSELEAELVRLCPGEREGLTRFFERLRAAIAVSKDMDLWHPGFGGRGRPGRRPDALRRGQVRAVAVWPPAGRRGPRRARRRPCP
ncbi:MAG: hypothetical protein MZV64_11875 [Ignavibacteriales bacterium]|nr:hypothetical protein [Ignavibacteriales bacterium]